MAKETATTEEVFHVLNDAVNKALAAHYGPGITIKGQRLPAAVAVALLQLSLRYFTYTKAPKAVVFDFFLSLMGIEGERATLKEIPGGKLVIVPPEQKIVLADNRGT